MPGLPLPPELDAELEALLAADPTPDQQPTDDALLRYAEGVVAAGHQAEAIAAAFEPPGPHDPLGILPVLPLTLLGQALLAARATRPGGYDWSAVAELRRTDEDMFLALVEDERMAVMDGVPVPGGLL